jgi:hypothetical protein
MHAPNPSQMFYIQKKGLCFTVVVNKLHVFVQENGNSSSSSDVLSQRIIQNLTALAEYHLKSVPPPERCSILMDYFREKGWTACLYIPELIVSKTGLLQSALP